MAERARQIDTQCQLFCTKLGELTEAQLKEYMLQFGTVTQCHIKRDDWNAGKSRGFGFVTFDSREPVVAILAQPEHIIDGVTIQLKVAEDRRHGANGANLTVQKPECERLFVGNLPETCKVEDLVAYFSQFGEVDEERCMAQEDKSFGFVHFKDADVAKAALEYEGHVIGGNNVTVQLSEGKKNRAAMSSKGKGKGQGGGRFGGQDNWGNGGGNWGNGGGAGPEMMMNMMQMMMMMNGMGGGNKMGMGGGSKGGSKGGRFSRSNPY